MTPVCDDSQIGATCFACLVSNPTDSSWGAIVQYEINGAPFDWELNLGGCFQVEGASAACAAATEEQAQCENAACNATCANALSSTADSDCVSSADTGVCASYVSAANNCASTSIQTACEGGSATTATFETAFKAIAQILCE